MRLHTGVSSPSLPNESASA